MFIYIYYNILYYHIFKIPIKIYTLYCINNLIFVEFNSTHFHDNFINLNIKI